MYRVGGESVVERRRGSILALQWSDLSSTHFGFGFSSSVNCGVGGTLNKIAIAMERVEDHF